MSFQTTCNAARAVLGHAVPLAIAGALALSACVPIPYPAGRQFVPNQSDLTVPLMDDGGCGFGPDFRAEGYREFGPVKVSTALDAPSEATAGSTAGLTVTFEERSRTFNFQSVSLNPDLVRLEEAGRSYPVVASDRNVFRRYESLNNVIYVLAFPAGTGFDDSIRFVFAPGAVTINGSPVEFGPIRFERRETMSVYLFPCIPS